MASGIGPEAKIASARDLLVTLGERIRLNQARLVEDFGLPIDSPLADAQLAPEMMIGVVNPHVTFRCALEFNPG